MATIVIPDTGLTVLHEPEGEDAVVDIVFVHGLQGHPRNTWSCKVSKQVPQAPWSTPQPSSSSKQADMTASSRKSLMFWRSNSPLLAQAPIDPPNLTLPTIYWPLDILAKDCPNARIMTWGYDSGVTRGYASADKGNIFSHAKNLLYALDRARDGISSRRGLIFVAHSLGGIIVKEVLRRSETAPEIDLKNILKSVIGIIFMGTPHRGSKDFAALGDVVRKLTENILRMDTNPTILRALGVDSPELELCRESFITQWREYNFKVKTFQEASGFSGVNIGMLNEKVVPDMSSSLDDPRERAETIPAKHLEMCRFSSNMDVGYLKVGPEIKRIVAAEIQRKSAQLNEHLVGERSMQPTAPITVRASYSLSILAMLENNQYGWQDYWHSLGILPPSSGSDVQNLTSVDLRRLASILEQQTIQMENKLARVIDQYRNVLEQQLLLFPNARQQRELFKIIMQAAEGSIASESDTGRTLLHYMATNGVAELLEPLVSAGLPVDRKDSDWQTALHVAVICNQDTAVKTLLEVCNADPHIPDLNGLIPWHLAMAIDCQNPVENQERAISKKRILRVLAKHTNEIHVRGIMASKLLKQLKENPEATLQIVAG